MGEGKGGMILENSIETYIIKCEQIASPGGCMRQVLEADALGLPRGMGWGGRWEGWFKMGNTCKSMADSYQCMAKTTTIL